MWRRADMTAVGELVLVLGLLVSAHCEVRARDPEVEEDEEELGGRGGGGGGGGRGVERFGTAVFPPHLERLHPGATETPPSGERGNYPTRTGNWCAFVQRRVVTTAMACGTEKYTIKSQSPCPSGTPDCQLIMYKLSTRPVYRQKQQIVTALLWRCCPGHGGKNCEDTGSEAQLDSPGSSALIGGSEPARTELRAPDVKQQQQLHQQQLHQQQLHQQQRSDPNREQNDHQAVYDTDHPDNQHNSTHPTLDPDHGHSTRHTSHHGEKTYDHHHHIHHGKQERHQPVADEVDAAALPYPEAPAALPYPDAPAALPYPEAPAALPYPDAPPALPYPEAPASLPYPDAPAALPYPDAPAALPYTEAPATLPYPDAPASYPYPEAPAVLPVPHMMALVMSQLQPVLAGFNRSLEHLSRQVGDLARDVAQLKSGQLEEAELQAGPPDRPELDEAAEERLDAKLDEAFQHVREVRRQLESQRTDMENRLHSQHAMLHFNLTSFKTDIDMKLKRHQKMLQVSLQAMNATLTEMKQEQDQDQHQDQHKHQDQDLHHDQEQDQDQTTEGQLEAHPSPPPGPPLQQPSDTSALWLAIERLDDMVVNNTVKVDGLMEDVDVTSGEVQQLRRDLKELENRINQTARTSQIQFMETGLEVEEAREKVLRRVGELALNVSQQGQRLQEMDPDVDYLFEVINKLNWTGDCDCKGLKVAVARLERGVANVTELANENRLALDEDGGAGQWGGADDWEPAVEALQRGLQQVKESLASDQSRTRTLDHSLSRLSGSVMVAVAEVSGLKDSDRKLAEDMQRLAGSFKSLLTDAIRHSDVLELLLGEEVLEFLEWPVQDQEAHSIPALKEQLRVLQEQLRGHDLSITSLQPRGRATEGESGGREEVPSADQPSSSSSSSQHRPDSWLPDGMRRSSGGVPARERQLLLHPEGRRPEHGGDGGDLWNLEKRVEELGLKLLRLEEKPCNTSAVRAEAPPAGVEGAEAKLQAELTWLKRGLEEHLRVFKNVFSNADVLASSDATLELDKLWMLVKNKEKKKGGRGGNHRSRREAAGVAPVPSTLSADSLLVVAGAPLSVSNGVISFAASLNSGHFYSDAGAFTAPLNGIYLFVLTLDLRQGPVHVVLRRSSGGAPVSLQRRQVTTAGPVTAMGLLPLRGGEEVRLELKGGARVESEDNVFTVLLLHRTT